MAQLEIRIHPDRDSEHCIQDFQRMNTTGLIRALKLLLSLIASGGENRYLRIIIAPPKPKKSLSPPTQPPPLRQKRVLIDERTSPPASQSHPTS